MRKSAFRSLFSQCRCLSLLFIVLLTVLGAESLNGRDRDGQSSARLERQEWPLLLGAGGQPYEKTMRLYNMCTQRNLRLLLARHRRKQVDAKGAPDDEYAKIVMSSVPQYPGEVRLRGVSINRYLCFNPKGRLVARYNGESRKCMFKEETDGGFITLRSVIREDWYVGFKKRSGRPLPGYKAKRKLKGRCIRFLKIDIEPETLPPVNTVGPLNGVDPTILREFMERQGHPHRHRHRHRHRKQHAPSPPPPPHSVGPLAGPDVDFSSIARRFQGTKR